MTDISGRLSLQEQLFKKYEEEGAKYHRDISGYNRKYKEQPFDRPLTYYESPVKNSHQYPNLKVIRNVNYDTIYTSPKVLIDKINKEPIVVGRLYETRENLKYRAPLLWS